MPTLLPPAWDDRDQLGEKHAHILLVVGLSLQVNRHPDASVNTAEQAVLTHFTAAGPLTPSAPIRCSEAVQLPEHSCETNLEVLTKDDDSFIFFLTFYPSDSDSTHKLQIKLGVKHKAVLICLSSQATQEVTML